MKMLSFSRDLANAASCSARFARELLFFCVFIPSSLCNLLQVLLLMSSLSSSWLKTSQTPGTWMDWELKSQKLPGKLPMATSQGQLPPLAPVPTKAEPSVSAPQLTPQSLLFVLQSSCDCCRFQPI